ncbi:MAG: YkgJ family cysteine cluster protein [Deltaproteobacteria bacterium]|nr:YkgJ family cysteine cluster protein [Deltaproteobacteria bacterium]
MAVLQELYLAWEAESAAWPLACGPGCSVCCTGRLNLTGLEARLLARGIRAAGGEELWQKALALPLAADSPPSTINQLAALCLAGGEPPAEEAGPPASGRCLFLAEGLCRVYQARPLVCRIMVSRQRCHTEDAAAQDAWWLTLGLAWSQLVEHAAQGEVYGPLARVLAAVEGRAPGDLAVCRPAPAFPAPPEHQAPLQEVLGRVLARPVLGRPLGEWLSRGWR